MEMETENGEIEDDFQEPLPIITQLGNKRRKPEEEEEEDNDNNTAIEESICSLCKCGWSIAGFHRIVSLRCGHLFGRSCITQCVRFSKKPKKGECPICGKIFFKKDICPIWPKKLIKPNPVEVQKLKQKLEQAKSKALEKQNTMRNVQAEIMLIRQELSKLNSSQPLLISTSQPSSSLATTTTTQLPQSSQGNKFNFIDWEAIQLSTENASRVLTFTHSQNDIVVSMKQDGKYGLNKIKIEAPTLSDFIGNHDKLIRDVKSSFHQNMILSTGLDKTLQLTSMDSNTVVQMYQLNLPGWSCSFDIKNPNLLYCGLSNDSLMVFDIRNTNSHLHQLKGKGNSPMHAIGVANSFVESNIQTTSVICSSLTSCYTWIFNSSSEPELVELHQDITGYRPFSIHCDDNTLLTSFRNNSSTKYVTSQFSSTDPKQVETDWIFDSDHSQDTMSRNIFFKRNEEMIYCFTDENKIDLRNKDGLMQRLQTNSNVFDVKHHIINDTELLASLSKNELKIFKYNEEEEECI